jgi:putative polyketide hydroxylase
VWLERDGRPLSTLDLFGRRFALLAGAGADGGAWCAGASAAAALAGLTLDIHRIGAAGGVANPDGSFAEAYGITSTGAAIVRPDGYVGWRAADGAGASRDALARVLASLLGRDESPSAA